MNKRAARQAERRELEQQRMIREYLTTYVPPAEIVCFPKPLIVDEVDHKSGQNRLGVFGRKKVAYAELKRVG